MERTTQTAVSRNETDKGITKIKVRLWRTPRKRARTLCSLLGIFCILFVFISVLSASCLRLRLRLRLFLLLLVRRSLVSIPHSFRILAPPRPVFLIHGATVPSDAIDLGELEQSVG
jgi:hypothetical protein